MELLSQFFARTSPWVAVLCGLLVLVTGLFLGARGARLAVVRRTAGNRTQGTVGAVRACALLRAAGYEILETEVTAYGQVEIDGVRQVYPVRCDAWVMRDGVAELAEFKGGPASGRIEHRATRRQLLEYAWVFDVETLLLVDAEAGEIRRVRFPTRFDETSRGGGGPAPDAAQ